MRQGVYDTPEPSDNGAIRSQQKATGLANGFPLA